MGLPKIDVPVIDIVLPYTNTKVKIRPFTVKEEKILLFAQNSTIAKEIGDAIRQVITNCIVNDVDILELPAFEVDYLFLKLRSISVNNIIKLKLKDEIDEEVFHDVEVDLEEVELVINKKVKDIVELNDQYNVKLTWPKFGSFESLNNIEEKDALFSLLSTCINSIFSKDNEEVYIFDEYSQQEKQEFLDSLSIANMRDLLTFFTDVPKIQHTIFYENSKGEKSEKTLSGIFDFFTFA